MAIICSDELRFVGVTCRDELRLVGVDEKGAAKAVSVSLTADPVRSVGPRADANT
jgi:hypothetical protein